LAIGGMVGAGHPFDFLALRHPMLAFSIDMAGQPVHYSDLSVASSLKCNLRPGGIRRQQSHPVERRIPARAPRPRGALRSGTLFGKCEFTEHISLNSFFKADRRLRPTADRAGAIMDKMPAKNSRMLRG